MAAWVMCQLAHPKAQPPRVFEPCGCVFGVVWINNYFMKCVEPASVGSEADALPSQLHWQLLLELELLV